jgi:polyhydroxyalkanoate synthase
VIIHEPITAAIIDNLTEFYQAIYLYQTHPYVRPASKAKILWQEGATKLLDYGDIGNNNPANPIVLFVPSLINKSYILDLMEERSLIGYLGANHIRSFLIDWGEPNEFEIKYNLEDYITLYILKIIDFITKQEAKEIIVIGYCMGGVMALGAAIARQEAIKGLVLLATPWDFAHDPQEIDFLATERIPAQVIQQYFSILDYSKIYNKYVKFAKLEQDSFAAQLFVAVERWVGDGISLSSRVFEDFYTLKFQELIIPQDFLKPVLVAIPRDDHIVPQKSAEILLKLLPGSKAIYYNSGHIGMVIGSSSQLRLWQDLKSWIVGC